MRKELEVKFGTAKSFYGKAETRRGVNCTELYSYDTLVCTVYDNDLVRMEAPKSNTTTRHIVEFLQQMGYPKFTKAELLRRFV